MTHLNIIEIVKRKREGFDCSESESAEIKGFLTETIILPNSGETQIVEDIQELFPLEYAEYLDQIEN